MALIKYPNRRIYDNELHRYFSVPELEKRLMAGERVIEKKTGADITDEVLVQLMAYQMKKRRGPSAEAILRLMQENAKERSAVVR